MNKKQKPAKPNSSRVKTLAKYAYTIKSITLIPVRVIDVHMLPLVAFFLEGHFNFSMKFRITTTIDY